MSAGYLVLDYRKADSEPEFDAVHKQRCETFHWLGTLSRADIVYWLHAGRITQEQFDAIRAIDDELMIAKRGYTSEGWSCAAIDRQGRIVL